MTRNEFWEDISSFSDIADFCREYGYDHYIDDLYSRSQLFDYIVEGSDDISDLYGYLCDIGDLDADWFSVDGGDIRSLDDDDFDGVITSTTSSTTTISLKTMMKIPRTRTPAVSTPRPAPASSMTRTSRRSLCSTTSVSSSTP